MKKKPRCYKSYKDDRICDICPIVDKCIYETQLYYEFERLKYKCKFRRENDYSFSTWCDNQEMLDYSFVCSPQINCFPEILRREKLKKLKEL